MIEKYGEQGVVSVVLLEQLRGRLRATFEPNPDIIDTDPGLPRTFSAEEIAEQRYQDFLDETADIQTALTSKSEYYRQFPLSSSQVRHFLTIVHRYRHTALDTDQKLDWYQREVKKPIHRMAQDILFSLAKAYVSKFSSRQTPVEIVDNFHSLQLLILEIEKDAPTNQTFFNSIKDDNIFSSPLRSAFNLNRDTRFDSEREAQDRQRLRNSFIPLLQDPAKFYKWIVKNTKQPDQMSQILTTIDELETLDEKQKFDLQETATQQLGEQQVARWKLELMQELSRAESFAELAEVIRQAATSDPPLIYLSTLDAADSAQEPPVTLPAGLSILEWEAPMIDSAYSDDWSGQIAEYIDKKFTQLCDEQIINLQNKKFSLPREFFIAEAQKQYAELLELRKVLLRIRVHHNQAPARWYFNFQLKTLETEKKLLVFLQNS